MPLDISTPLATDAGLFGLWRTSAFAHVTDLDQFEDEVVEDASLLRHIAAAAFVPINIRSDGAYQFHLRGTRSPGNLTDRERAHLVVSSQPYLITSDGHLELGSLEGVGTYTGTDTVEVPLPAGDYAVVVHLIDWQAEEGSRDDDGDPTPNALPDFLIEIYPAPPTGTYRQSVETFDRPES